MSDDMFKTWEERKPGCGAFIAASTFILAFSAFQFFVEAHLYAQAWAWFVVPLGVIAIGPWHVAGLRLVIRACGSSHPLVDRIAKHLGVDFSFDTNEKMLETVATAFARGIGSMAGLWGWTHLFQWLARHT